VPALDPAALGGRGVVGGSGRRAPLAARWTLQASDALGEQWNVFASGSPRFVRRNASRTACADEPPAPRFARGVPRIPFCGRDVYNVLARTPVENIITMMRAVGTRKLVISVKWGSARVVPFPSFDCSLHEVFNRFLGMTFALEFVALQIDEAVNLSVVAQR
jgi:hypothetical protein